MLTRVVDRSADGSMFQLQCECCGKALDWVSGLELTCMAVMGLHNWCFDCAGEVANLVPAQLLIEGQTPDVYIIESDVNIYADCVYCDNRIKWSVYTGLWDHLIMEPMTADLEICGKPEPGGLSSISIIQQREEKSGE